MNRYLPLPPLMTLSGNEYTVGRGSSRLLLSSRSIYSMKLQAPRQGWISGSATEYSYFLQTDCWNIWYLFPTKEGHCESSHSSKNYVTFFGKLLNHLTKNPRVGILSPNPRHLYIRSWKKVKALVAQSCPTICDPVDCSPPGSSVHEILQARILEWVAIPFSRGSSHPRDQKLARG